MQVGHAVADRARSSLALRHPRRRATNNSLSALLDARVTELLAAAPPLSDRQVARLRLLLAPRQQRGAPTAGAGLSRPSANQSQGGCRTTITGRHGD